MINSLIFLIVGYTSMFAFSGSGDIRRSLFNPLQLERQGKLSIYFSGGFTRASENRYQYVYDSYDNTVGKITVYSHTKFYTDLPDFLTTYRTGKRVFGYLGSIKFADLNYIFRQKSRDPNYVVREDSVLEQTGTIRFYKVGAGSQINLFTLLLGIVYAHGSQDSLTFNGFMPEVGAGFFSPNIDIILHIYPGANLQGDVDKKLPPVVHGDLTLKAPSKQLDRVTISLTYENWEKSYSYYHNTIGGMISLYHTFQDVTTLGVGGSITTSYVDGETYIPTYRLYVSYRLNLMEVGSFINYTPFSYNKSEKIEESKLSVNLFIKMNL